MSYTEQAKSPPLFWALMEGRAVFELGWFYTLRAAMRYLPKGDGHPVLVLPGFVASDGSTRPLRGVLDDLGYSTYGWGLGRNLRFDAERERLMAERVAEIAHEEDQKVSIIGWSLGGLFARELAKDMPDKVRSVISLGSPITGDREHSHARHLFTAINGDDTHYEDERIEALAKAPPVPTTSIYSKTDGVVGWRGSLQKSHNDGNFETENIEVPASHFGMGVNPLVIYAIADRLAQPEGEWAPFDREGVKGLVYPRPEAS